MRFRRRGPGAPAPGPQGSPSAEGTLTPVLTVYSTPWCGYCRRLMKALDREGVAYTSVDIERRPDAAQYVMDLNGGNQTVPTVVFTDGTSVTNPSAKDVLARLSR